MYNTSNHGTFRIRRFEFRNLYQFYLKMGFLFQRSHTESALQMIEHLVLLRL